MRAPSLWAFLLDENMPKRAATALRRAGYAAARVIEVGLRAQKDSIIFAYAHAHGLIIVTRDADFLASQYQSPHAGIILLSLPGVPGRAVVDPLMAALTSLRGQDLTNKVYLIASDGLHVVWVWSKAKLVDTTKVSQIAGTEELENLSNYTEAREQDAQSHQTEAEGEHFSFEQQKKMAREISGVSVHTRWCSTAGNFLYVQAVDLLYLLDECQFSLSTLD